MKPDINQILATPKVVALAALLKCSPREVLEWSPTRFAVNSAVIECARSVPPQRRVLRG